MVKRLVSIAIIGTATTCSMLADFSYDQTSTLTGGVMATTMKMAGAFSKAAREPNRSRIMIKGDRMAHWTATHGSIIDLSAETITDIDLQKKTYSVITFAQMKELMQSLGQASQSGNQANFKVTADVTGKTRSVNGIETKEMIITMVMESSDPAAGQNGAMTMKTDSWLAAAIPGYDEVRDFYKRMAQKIDWAPGGGMISNPNMTRGMAAAAKEMSKVDGVPVLQYLSMTGVGAPGAAGSANLTPEQQRQLEDAQKQQQQAQQQQQQQPQVEKPTAGSVAGGILGGKLGRFGGFGRKKEPAKPAEQPAPAATPAPATAPAATATPQAPASTPGALMEMTIETTNFSRDSIAADKLTVPAGFKQVENERGRRR